MPDDENETPVRKTLSIPQWRTPEDHAAEGGRRRPGTLDRSTRMLLRALVAALNRYSVQIECRDMNQAQSFARWLVRYGQSVGIPIDHRPPPVEGIWVYTSHPRWVVMEHYPEVKRRLRPWMTYRDHSATV